MDRNPDVTVPKELLKAGRALSDTQFRLWCLIKSYESCGFFPSIPELTEMIGRNRSVVEKNTRKMEEIGLISVDRKIGYTNIYTFHDPETWWNTIGKELNNKNREKAKQLYSVKSNGEQDGEQKES